MKALAALAAGPLSGGVVAAIGTGLEAACESAFGSSGLATGFWAVFSGADVLCSGAGAFGVGLMKPFVRGGAGRAAIGRAASFCTPRVPPMVGVCRGAGLPGCAAGAGAAGFALRKGAGGAIGAGFSLGATPAAGIGAVIAGCLAGASVSGC
ncbi:hypothetical protein GCM10007094_21500 [Pseudovibrio japonicus]|uniref:Uncharacterized protein n=1 Tax=Pseudovibrio japonicus TaxID=366534 RepID=A0ABQ3EBM5_9HYPH|nr:hypothetical protein GCM10007094_21500 [Pseudovibrio japonicus]